ncbi:MAG: ABC transporter permease subunit [Verrucomicrobiota bacterium]
MVLLPIVDRELRLAARRHSTYYARVAFAGVAVLFATALFLYCLDSGARIRVYGRTLMIGILVLGYLYSVVYGVALTADTISQEKREDTLGLLFLTDLKGYDIVLGKWVANLLHALGGLLAIVPIPALGFLFGGATWQDYVFAVATMLVTLLFATAVGIFFSALMRRQSAALISAWLVVAIPWLICALNAAGRRAGIDSWDSLSLLLASPAVNLVAILTDWSGGTVPPGLQCGCLLVTLGATFVLLLIASFSAPRRWQVREPLTVRPSMEARTEQKLEQALGLDRWWSRQRAASRHRQLEDTPTLWLAERLYQLRLSFWAIGLLLFLGTVFILSVTLRGDAWLTAFLGGCLLISLTVKVRVLMQAARAFAESRRSGALATLLVTPLSTRDLIRGHLLGIKRDALVPVALCLLLQVPPLLIALIGLHPWQLVAVLVVFGLPFLMLLTDLYALSWWGLWLGLKEGRAMRATQRGLFVAFILQAPTWIAWLILLAVRWENMDEEILWGFAPLLALNIFINLSLVAYALGKLQDEFHILAVAPVGPGNRT